MNGRNYSSREEEIRSELSFEEVVRRIKEVYQTEYDPDRPKFDPWDQLLACEAVAESTPVNQEYERKMNENSSVNGMNNDSYKHNVIFELTPTKQQVITKLNKCNYRTKTIQISHLLEEFFDEWKSYDKHWLYIAQHWAPRAINRTINHLIKLHSSGRVSIYNPSAFFTKLIKYRKRRKTNYLY